MDDPTRNNDEPLLDPVDGPRSGKEFDWIAGMKNQPARFGCLGLGCLPWLAILAVAFLAWLLLVR